jgi:septum formation protein
VCAAFYLASQSPRRRRLLDQLGVRFKPLAVEIDETWDSIEPVRDYVVRLAIEKARAGWRKISETEPLPVLGADTVVVLDDAILGKPSHRDEGLAMLARLSGRCHHVYTAMAMIVPPGDKQQLRINLSRVHFRPLTTSDMEAYWATGEPLGKAGGYAIQGLAAAFIERIEGSYSGVMGLPLYETAELLSLIGIDFLIRSRAQLAGPRY